jgi:hypothetical protein
MFSLDACRAICPWFAKDEAHTLTLWHVPSRWEWGVHKKAHDTAASIQVGAGLRPHTCHSHSLVCEYRTYPLSFTSRLLTLDCRPVQGNTKIHHHSAQTPVEAPISQGALLCLLQPDVSMSMQAPQSGHSAYPCASRTA